MIFTTGDTHGSFQRFGSKCFPQQKVMGRDDYMIVCGDFGGIFDGSPREEYWLDWLEGKPFTTLFVDGNHENFDRLNALPVHQWHGGNVHYIRPHVLHLMRGQVFDIGGKTFFTMGGAASHDIQDGILDPAQPDFEREYWFKRRTRQFFRVKGISWWPEELPSGEEYNAALESLERAGWKVDYVITHCASTSVIRQLNRDYQPDTLTDFLEMVERRLEFGHWLFGHYHRNQAVDEKHTLLWEDIVQLT